MNLKEAREISKNSPESWLDWNETQFIADGYVRGYEAGVREAAKISSKDSWIGEVISEQILKLLEKRGRRNTSGRGKV